MRRTVVYIACPMRKGHWTDNVRRAAQVGRDMVRKGYSVINPVSTWLVDLVEPMPIGDWLANDFGIIEVCDCVYRLPGESEGADLELDYAVRHHVPIFDDLAELYVTMQTETT